MGSPPKKTFKIEDVLFLLNGTVRLKIKSCSDIIWKLQVNRFVDSIIIQMFYTIQHKMPLTECNENIIHRIKIKCDQIFIFASYSTDVNLCCL